MGFVVIVLDFGFLLSATKSVSEKRDDPAGLSELLTAVTFGKAVIASALLVLTLIACYMIPALGEHWELTAFYFIAYAAGSFLPDYMYRGLEDMKAITVRTVSVRVFCVGLTFAFLHGPEDVLVLPFLLFIGNAVAVWYSFFDLSRRCGIRLSTIGFQASRSAMKASFPFFASRFASTAYQSLNAVLLGTVFPGSPVVGFYTSADKFLSLAKTASSPIADSLFPYMTRNKNFALCKKLLLGLIPLLAIFGCLVFTFSSDLCSFVFGREYYEAGELLRCLLPAMLVIPPTYIICFPMLVPMGLSRYANLSTFVGAFIQLAAIVLLFVAGAFTAKNLCLAASLSEVSVFVYRVVVMLKFWDRTNVRE